MSLLGDVYEFCRFQKKELIDKCSCLWETVCAQIGLNHGNEQMLFLLLSAGNMMQYYRFPTRKV